jgi:hypothetical protein
MQDAPYREIPVKATGGVIVYAKVSPDDYEWLAQFPWRINTGGYARRSKRVGNRQRPEFVMHREIMGLAKGDGLQVDHINRDRLDNRRENLRIVTMEENNRNVSPCRNSTSRYRGVCWYKKIGKWRASAEFKRQGFHLGDFQNEDDAARAVNAFWVERGYPAWNDVSETACQAGSLAASA